MTFPFILGSEYPQYSIKVPCIVLFRFAYKNGTLYKVGVSLPYLGVQVN